MCDQIFSRANSFSSQTYLTANVVDFISLIHEREKTEGKIDTRVMAQHILSFREGLGVVKKGWRQGLVGLRICVESCPQPYAS